MIQQDQKTLFEAEIVSATDNNNNNNNNNDNNNKPVGDMVRSRAAERVLMFVQKGT